MKPPVTMVCSIPVSAAWNAFCRCCSLPAMTNSTAAAFMPATASSVITSNSSSATTSAAPRCLPPPPVLKCVFVTTGILWLNLSTRCGSEWFSRPTGAGSALLRQAVSVLVRMIGDEARLRAVGAHQDPDPHRDDLRRVLRRRRSGGQQVRQRRARVEIFARSAARCAAAAQIDPVLHLQVLDAGHQLLVRHRKDGLKGGAGAGSQGLAPQRGHAGRARALIA